MHARWLLRVSTVMCLASACARPFGVDSEEPAIDRDSGTPTQASIESIADASRADVLSTDASITTEASSTTDASIATDAQATDAGALVPVWEKDIARWPGEYSFVSDFAVDPNDRVIATGSCTTDTSEPCRVLGNGFGGYDLGLGKESGNVFVVSYDAAGTPLWDKVWTATSEPVSPYVTTDAAGNVFVVMTVTGSIDFGGGTRTLSSELVIASYEGTGTYRWDRVISSDLDLGKIFVRSIVGGPADEIAIRGVSDTWDGVVLAIGANGVTRWTKSAEGTPLVGYGDVRAVGIDSSGRVITLGRYVDPTASAFLAAWSSTGSLQWDVAPGPLDLELAVDGTDIFTVGGANLTRRTSSSAIVYSVPSGQTPQCSSGICMPLPFAVSPAYDELWYAVSATEGTVVRRKKSDGSGVTSWTPAFGPPGPSQSPFPPSATLQFPGPPRKMVVMPQGDIVATSGIGLLNGLLLSGSVGRLTRFARPN